MSVTGVPRDEPEREQRVERAAQRVAADAERSRERREARAYLESLGTRFDGDTYEISGMVKLATFYDPDGNAWMLAQALDDRIARSGSRAIHVRRS